jgi:glycosyltransferase involved in cell wall biosynthesis
MRILLIHWRYDAFGGGESYLEQLATLLESSGHRLCLMTGVGRSDPDRMVPGRDHVLVTESGGVRSGLRELNGVMREIEAIAPDLVHFHHTDGLLSPYIVQAINRRYPTIKTIHDVSVVCPLGDEMIKQYRGELCEYPFSSGCVFRGCYRVADKGIAPLLSTLWERRATRQLDRLLVSTEYMRRELLRNEFPDQRISVLPLFTAMNQNGSVETAAAAQNRLLFVGRLDRAKGGQELVDAVMKIDSLKNWQLDVIGEGEMLPVLQQQVGNSAVGGRIRFLGRVEATEMPEYYRQARFLVMPSMIPESFGLVGIEAMACGRPVVAFDSGGIKDWLADGNTGFLVERGNTQELASRIEQLLTDDSLVAAMGQRAMRRVELLYRPEAHLSRLNSLYEAVATAGKKVR